MHDLKQSTCQAAREMWVRRRTSANLAVELLRLVKRNLTGAREWDIVDDARQGRRGTNFCGEGKWKEEARRELCRRHGEDRKDEVLREKKRRAAADMANEIHPGYYPEGALLYSHTYNTGDFFINIFNRHIQSRTEVVQRFGLF